MQPSGHSHINGQEVPAMLKARHDKEIVVRVENAIGRLADLSKVVAEKGINILAMNGWVEGNEGVIRLVTEDNLRAGEALTQHGYPAEQRDAILIEAAHKPGVLRHLTQVLAKENIDITHLYASATLGQDVCLVVLATSNNERALVLLNA